jgi:transcription elongation GreA/GreB family factor
MQTPPSKIPFTQEAFDKMKAEVQRLNTYREEVVIRLQAAREQGDLSENGAYKYAKFELGNIGRQLRDLKYKLTFGYVPVKAAAGVIDFGATITIKNDTKDMTFMLVSEHESNPTQNKLSTNSPIGNAVKGKKVGDVVEVVAPAGVTKWKIMKVE